ncbi:YhjD/YihY/BrkB family envelope integrity protein [Nordella sp. HKS 07]|uniref:YhjD/YihY/BrkB family envelope integrity protein n=1 Tax=Nordella sp. HKS 07 TaxID=2712222 RepID=UPI002110DF7C|nr:YhjD/YihY/BrkB family envelope integrity protein [Nordella sp. HKS 07]
MSAAIFSAMFKWLPDASTSWSDILPGALLTAALFEVGRFLISFYDRGLESTYGAAGSIVAILI